MVLVSGLLPTAEVDRRLPGLSVGAGDVVTQFGVPYQVLQEVHFCEDVTCQLTALQGVLVHVGQGHRVGIGVSLTHLCIVVAEDIVDGDVGQSGQRIGDDTLCTVGTLQVVVGGREGGRHA